MIHGSFSLYGFIHIIHTFLLNNINIFSIHFLYIHLHLVDVNIELIIFSKLDDILLLKSWTLIFFQRKLLTLCCSSQVQDILKTPRRIFTKQVQDKSKTNLKRLHVKDLSWNTNPRCYSRKTFKLLRFKIEVVSNSISLLGSFLNPNIYLYFSSNLIN